MKDSILCCAFCLGLGMVVGGVVVSNNSKVRNWLRKVSSQACETYEQVKDTIEEKVDEAKAKSAINQNNGTKR